MRTPLTELCELSRERVDSIISGGLVVFDDDEDGIVEVVNGWIRVGKAKGYCIEGTLEEGLLVLKWCNQSSN